MKKEDIIVIVPIHEYNNKVHELLGQAVSSVPSDVDVCFSCNKECYGNLAKDFADLKPIIIPSESSSFQHLVNAAVKHIDSNEKKYSWFSILEYDDTYTPYWFDEAIRYYEAKPEVSMLMPLTDLVKEHEGEKRFYGYGNEAPWASAFSNEIGYIDFDVLNTYFDFYATGSLLSIDDFLSVGGLKESIKLSFWFEFMLRLTDQGKKIFVVPKVGYVHWVGRENSLFDTYSKTMDKKESEWWNELAKQECFFKKDRNKRYEQNKDKEEE